MDPRPYSAIDHATCLALLPDLAVPQAFFVLEHEGQILACGGYVAASRESVEIVQYTVHPDWRLQGLGRFLIFYLLKQIATLGSIAQVQVQCPPDASGFFERQGFHQIAPGRYNKKLTVCA